MKKKKKISDKGSIATMGEGYPSHDSRRGYISTQKTNGFKKRLKGLLEFCDSATEPKLESMMEKLSPWVAFKRSMNLLDNIFAAGLFSFFVAWTANYLGYHAEPDLGSAISKSLNEIIPGSPKEALLFLFYLCAFWRTIRITRVMPLDRYVDKNILLYVCIAFIAVFIFISLVIYATEKKMILVYGETEEEAQDPNIPFYVAGLRWGVFTALFAYRRILLPRRLKEYKLPDVRIPLPVNKE